jgi:hypothetical protein
MQDMNQEFGFSTQDDTTQSRNLAAIALAEAMNRARAQQTGRESTKIDLRAGAVARLEVLRKKLAPLYSAIPHDVELFDLGLISHEKPRLFVDIIAFIELNRDQTGYRFLQETRAGRAILAETGDEKHLIAVVTDYVARRLIERELALSAGAPLAPTIGQTIAASSASSHAQSSVPTKPSVPHMMTNAVTTTYDTAPHDEVVLKRGIEPAITAAEAFRQWSPSSATTMASAEQPSQVEQLINAHKAAEELADRKPTNVQALQAQMAAVGELVRPTILPHAETAIDTIAAQTHLEKLAAPAHVLTKMPLPVAITPAVVESVTAALQSPVVAEHPVATKIALHGQTGAAKTVAGLATTAGAVAAATPLATTTLATRKTSSVWTPGWWIWPLLALLLGIGLGAFMLYVYAANLVR